MFERFTDRARRVVVLAQEEARDLGHNYIGTEHILLGLLRESDGVAAQALEALDIHLGAVRREVREIIGKGEEHPSGHIPFTPRAKKVLELSLREALQLGHNYIGTEHILLGLIREGEGVAAQVLVTLGADLNRVRLQVIELLHRYQRKEPAAAGEPGGEAWHEEAARRAATGQTTMEARLMRSARMVSQTQLDSVMARIGDVVSRLDLIAERLAAIEGHLAEGRRPAARAPRKPPAARAPKPPPKGPGPGPASGETKPA
jgi:ATP-dependent Clp protease ATP-binding subunit ClpC